MDSAMQVPTRTNQPCAACRMLRRRCSNSCLLAPYFPIEETDNFIRVHKVFGASNVIKTLQMLDENRREDAVKSMVYEAKTRLRDPVYGCTGVIFFLQKHVKDLELQLEMAKEQFLESQSQRDQLLGILMDANNRFNSVTPVDDLAVFDCYDWVWDDSTIFGCDPFEYSTDFSGLHENLGFQDHHGQTSCST